jgi:toxin ParE1/3/4
MIRLRSLAVEAVMEQAEYIGRSSPAASDKFLLATELTFTQLEQMPGMGHRYESTQPRLAGVRVWSVKGFPNHLVFYRPVQGGIEVILVIHGARDIPTVLAQEIRKGRL